MCQELDRYLERTRTEPDTPWGDPQASLSKSRACGCRYCHAASELVGDRSDVKKTRIRNEDAVTANSNLSFSQPSKIQQKEQDVVTASFKSSGLNFVGEGRSGWAEGFREVFVTDRKLNVSDT